tara:strand:+ start:157 stop:942 length:786 start_codon:yes stop_codon:yes gene_type:complete
MSKTSRLEETLGINWDDPNLDPEIKSYYNTHIKNKDAIYYNEAQEHIKAIQKIQNKNKELSKMDKDLLFYSSVLKQTPEFKAMDFTTQQASLDSLPLYLYNKSDFYSFKPEALKKMDKKTAIDKEKEEKSEEKKKITPKTEYQFNVDELLESNPEVLDLFPNWEGEELILDKSQLNEVEKRINKKYNVKTKSFEIKDKAKYDEKYELFVDKVANEKFKVAEKLKTQLVAMNPDAEADLNAIIQYKKDNPTAKFSNMWNLFK